MTVLSRHKLKQHFIADLDHSHRDALLLLTGPITGIRHETAMKHGPDESILCSWGLGYLGRASLFDGSR